MNNLAREVNRIVGARHASPTNEKRSELHASARLLGLFSHAAIDAYLDATRNLDAKVLEQLRIRDGARTDRDFTRADEIRDELIAEGYEVFDMGGAPSRAIKRV